MHKILKYSHIAIMMFACFLAGYMFGKKDIQCKTTFEGNFYQQDGSRKNKIHISVDQGERGYVFGPFQMCDKFKLTVDRIETFKNHFEDYQRSVKGWMKGTK